MDYGVGSEYNEKDECWDVTVSGEIDIFNSTDFKDALIALSKEKQSNLRIDCANLQYIDSTALGSLVAVLKSVKLYGGEVRLRKVKSNIAKLFKITNLDKAFVIEGESHE